MGNMTYPGYYGYSTGSFIVWILMLLIKIFAYTSFLAVAIGIFMWIRKSYFERENQQEPIPEKSLLRKDTSILKAVAAIGAAIVGIGFVFALFSTFSRNGMNYSYGISPIYMIIIILMFIVKTMIAVLIISLIMAAVSIIKEQFDNSKVNNYETNDMKTI